mgnify:CR=1 FL=1|jgi:hypothetical protein
MHEDAAKKEPQRRSIMYRKQGFIRRFTNEAIQFAQLLSFKLEVEVNLTEDDIARDLGARG